MATKQILICDGCEKELDTYFCVLPESAKYYENPLIKLDKYDLCKNCYGVVQNLRLLKHIQDEFS